jgi:hypothetical protein
MNEIGQEALVRAALNGTKQIKHAFKDHSGGRCAMGVILEKCGIAFNGDLHTDIMGERLKAIAGIELDEARWVTIVNDVKGWDFLTIARKFANGIPELCGQEVKEAQG